MEESGGGEICRLPEGCISHVISLTSPRDACRSSAVSPAFRSAAGADTVWKRFLPSDYPSILSRASSPVEYSSKKELFFRLCDHPILIDDGNLTFGLERSSGAKCYMLSARALWIVWSDTPQYWTWIPLYNARFSEGAELLAVCWLEISGKIESKVLSPKTTYAAYFVFKLAEQSRGLSYPRQETCVTIGSRTSTRTVRLRDSATDMHRGWNVAGEEGIDGAVESPQERQDGWMEMEMGEFYNDTGEDGEVAMSLKEIRGGNWKRGLIIQGIEIRPKLP